MVPKTPPCDAGQRVQLEEENWLYKLESYIPTLPAWSIRVRLSPFRFNQPAVTIHPTHGVHTAPILEQIRASLP